MLAGEEISLHNLSMLVDIDKCRFSEENSQLTNEVVCVIFYYGYQIVVSDSSLNLENSPLRNTIRLYGKMQNI